MRTWERRAAKAAAEDPSRPPLPRPRFMHSNLKDVDMVLDMCRCRAAGSEWVEKAARWVRLWHSTPALAKSGPGRPCHRMLCCKACCVLLQALLHDYENLLLKP